MHGGVASDMFDKDKDLARNTTTRNLVCKAEKSGSGHFPTTERTSISSAVYTGKYLGTCTDEFESNHQV